MCFSIGRSSPSLALSYKLHLTDYSVGLTAGGTTSDWRDWFGTHADSRGLLHPVSLSGGSGPAFSRSPGFIGTPLVVAVAAPGFACGSRNCLALRAACIDTLQRAE